MAIRAEKIVFNVNYLVYSNNNQGDVFWEFELMCKKSEKNFVVRIS